MFLVRIFPHNHEGRWQLLSIIPLLFISKMSFEDLYTGIQIATHPPKTVLPQDNLYINTLVHTSVTVQRSIGNAHVCHSWQHANSKHARKEGWIGSICPST